MDSQTKLEACDFEAGSFTLPTVCVAVKIALTLTKAEPCENVEYRAARYPYGPGHLRFPKWGVRAVRKGWFDDKSDLPDAFVWRPEEAAQRAERAKMESV